MGALGYLLKTVLTMLDAIARVIKTVKVCWSQFCKEKPTFSIEIILSRELRNYTYLQILCFLATPSERKHN